jgi:DNA-binding LacI/PurR family transcriptional regulator
MIRRVSASSPPDARSARRRSGRVTALDVARLAGVSRSAVSRTLTEGASVASETRRRVLEAAEQLGYRPNLMARSLMTQRSQVVALLMGQLRNPFFADMLGEFTAQLRERGYQTLLQTVSPQFGLEAAVEAALQYQLDGLLMVSCNPSGELAARCRRHRLPVVVVDRTGGADLNQVWIQSEQLGVAVAERFLAEGRRRFALLEGFAGEPLSRRSRSFMQRVQQSGHSVVIEYGGYYYDGGREAARRLLRSDGPPDAIFCVTDSMAFAVVDTARHKTALRVPEDLSVIGFSDVPIAAWPSYGLTTARLPLRDIVMRSVGMLLEHIEHPDRPPQQALLECPLIERGTTLALSGQRGSR